MTGNCSTSLCQQGIAVDIRLPLSQIWVGGYLRLWESYLADHLVVEVKYWREKVSPQELISQIAEDVSLYLKIGSPYRKVLPIVWDQGRRTEEYDLLIAGLNQIRDVVSPVFIAQPAFMG